MKKLKSIKTFIEGEMIQGFYLCTQKHVRFTRNGEKYLNLELRDITGIITAKIWHNVDVLSEKFKAGNAVAVYGNVEVFSERLQLIIKKINKATIQHYSRYGFDPAKVVPSSKKNPKKMWLEIENSINRINDKFLKRLIKLIYQKNRKRLLYLPGSVKMHYSYRSGFIEQITSTIKLAKKICTLYDVDSDLVFTGIYLGNIGKIYEINSEYQVDYTVKGNLIGSGPLGTDIVRDEILGIKNFPSEYREKILHIILSCQLDTNLQHYRQASFPEAVIVSQIILLDVNLNLMDMALNEDQEEGIFTNKHNIFKIPLLKKNESK